MELSEIYDNKKYTECLLKSLMNLKANDPDAILYIIKSLISIDGFKVNSISQYKILIFYYFYRLGKVEFEGGYTLVMNNTKYNIGLSDIISNNINFDCFINICDFGKNEHFLLDINNDNVIDYILSFIKENSELYAFSGEHFPLFKWIINEIVE